MSSMLHYRSPASARQLPVVELALVGDPFAANRAVNFCEADHRYIVGTVRADAENLHIEHFPWVELTLIETGQVWVEGNGFNILAKAGDVLLIPRGLALRWHHDSELQRMYMAFPGKASEGDMPAAPIKFDLTVKLESDDPPAASVLMTEAPVTAGLTLFSSGNGALRIGIWESTPYTRSTIDPGYCELMHVLAGKIILQPVAGEVCEVVPGETVVVPARVRNAWTNEVPVRKLWCKLT